MQDSLERFWLVRAARLRDVVNSGLLLGAAQRWVTAACLLGALAVLFVRAENAHTWVPAAACIPLVAGILAAWLEIRRSRFSTDDALLRLDTILRLDNRLTVARAGISDWPAQRDTGQLLRFRPGTALMMPLAGLALLGSALWWPLPAQGSSTIPQLTQSPPSAWERMAEWVDKLKDLDLVEPEALKQWQERAESLAQQRPEDWHSAHSLEATLHLQQEMRQAAAELAAQMAAASGALESAASGAMENVNPADAQAMADAWQQLADDMAMGTMPLRQDLADKLREMGANAANIDPDLLRKMQERMKKGAQSLADNFQLSDNDLQPWDGPLPGQPGEGEGPGWGDGEIQRGPGHVPLLLDLSQGTFPAEGEGRLETEVDAERALPGDTLGVSTAGAPEQAAFSGPSASGTQEFAGQGGDAQLPSNVRPSEAEVLKRYFSK